MEDWAEVHRLFHREGRPKAAIARHRQDPPVDRVRGRGCAAWPAGCLRDRPPVGQPAGGGQAGRPTRRRARAARPDPAAHRRRGRLHPLRSRGRGALLRPDQFEVRAPFAHRQLEQDVQRVGRDLRRPSRRGGDGRPARPPRRGHRPQGRQLQAPGQAGGGADRREGALTCSVFSRRFLLRFGPALTACDMQQRRERTCRAANSWCLQASPILERGAHSSAIEHLFRKQLQVPGRLSSVVEQGFRKAQVQGSKSLRRLHSPDARPCPAATPRR